jgi:pyruvate dehydrogenase E1 component
VPGLRAYDPTYAYELAVIVRDGLERMLERGEDALYYLTVGNEAYLQPALPEGAEQGILRGLYRVRPSELAPDEPAVTLLGSGAILREVLAAAERLEDELGIAADEWSATSWRLLHDEALEAERARRLCPDDRAEETWLERCLGTRERVFVAASDYVSALPGLLARWLPGPLVPLGTDGFGLSESREALREHFEVNARHVALGAVAALARRGELDQEASARARAALGFDDEPDDEVE